MVKKDKKFNVVAAIKNEKVVGGIIFTRKKPDFVYIDLIGVSPEFWGKGIGTKLIKNIKKFFPKTKKLALVVRRANLPAILFYEKLGFEITDFTQPGYSRTHFVGMENKPTTIQA